MKKNLLIIGLFISLNLQAKIYNIHNNSAYYTVTISPNQNPKDPSAVIITKSAVLAKKDIPCSQNSLIITTNDPAITPNTNSPAKNQTGFNSSSPQTLNIDCSDYRILDIWLNEAKNGIFAVTTQENRPTTRAKKSEKKKVDTEEKSAENTK